MRSLPGAYRGRDRRDRVWTPDPAGRRQYRPRSGAAARSRRADRSSERRNCIGGACHGAEPWGGTQALMDIGATRCPAPPIRLQFPLAEIARRFPGRWLPQAYPRRAGKGQALPEGAVFFARRCNGAFSPAAARRTAFSPGRCRARPGPAKGHARGLSARRRSPRAGGGSPGQSDRSSPTSRAELDGVRRGVRRRHEGHF